jgi:hypothetical protein
MYNTDVALSTNFPNSSVSPSRTQPGAPRHAVLIHGVQLPVSYSSPVLFDHSVLALQSDSVISAMTMLALLSLGWLHYRSAGFAITRLALLSIGWPRSAGFAITRLALLSIGWPRSAGFAITRLALLSIGWPRSAGFAITRLASLSLGWFPYHSVVSALRYHSVGFAITRLASLSLGLLRYRKKYSGTQFCYIIAFAK